VSAGAQLSGSRAPALSPTSTLTLAAPLRRGGSAFIPSPTRGFAFHPARHFAIECE
jgi:hypothetical protein